MKIIAVSDFHGHTGRLEALRGELAADDVLIAAGDLTHFGGAPEAMEVLDALESLGATVLAVSGNCDLPAVETVLAQRGVGLDGRLQEIGGLAFFGVGGSLPCPGPTPNERSEEQYARLLQPARSATLPLVLISHQPPYDTALDMISTGLHVGSKSVRAFIEEYQPLLCVCGHIHEACGTDRIGRTRLVNPGPLQHGGFASGEMRNGALDVVLKKIAAGRNRREIGGAAHQ